MPSFSTVLTVRALWQERRKVLPIVVGFILLGIVVSLLMQPEFRSEVRLMPEMSSSSSNVLKRLASVAGFAGVDLSDEGVDAVRPDLYPNVLQSTFFVLYLIQQPVTASDGRVQTIEKFLGSYATPWLGSELMAWSHKDVRPLRVATGTLQLSVRQHRLAEEIGERVTAKFDTRSGIITITATMPDAGVSATVAQLAMNYLTRYVRNYRTEKVRQDLDFYRQQLDDARKRYHSAQWTLFRYDEQHKNVVLLSTTMDRQRMEAELTIAQTVYTQLAGEYEQAKLKVQALTPVFKVLEPPKVPLRRIAPKRTLVVLLFAGAGLALGVLYVLARSPAMTTRLRAMLIPGKDDSEEYTQRI
ncbi:GNVR domain-containing protein [Spirosoma fluviale]|uniref:G-rich domain on putative tyrosine kinase n=1 Tax=Spirosoma fluviale TaxID=1597977 RepID=A0A286G4L6_9BACT|nr:GNVR domain-containing protein [Spirosoma fluviale]SOD90176.1 G-rich domain on putative tyrosine kinase [Spirosoma fluviale]